MYLVIWVWYLKLLRSNKVLVFDVLVLVVLVGLNEIFVVVIISDKEMF